MIDFTTIDGCRVAFRQLYNQVQSIFNWDIGGSRLQNVANGVNPQDAVNLSQLNSATGQTPVSSGTSSPAPTAIVNFKTINAQTILPFSTSAVIGAIANAFSVIYATVINVATYLIPAVNNTADLGTSALRFRKLWGYSADLATTINMSGLTASLPLQLDSSKNMVSLAIDLTGSGVTNDLPVAKGGTSSGTAGGARTALNAANAATYTCTITVPLTGTISGTANLITGAVTGTCTITAGTIQVTVTP